MVSNIQWLAFIVVAMLALPVRSTAAQSLVSAKLGSLLVMAFRSIYNELASPL